jgi:hypothetical protein
VRPAITVKQACRKKYPLLKTPATLSALDAIEKTERNSYNARSAIKNNRKFGFKWLKMKKAVHEGQPFMFALPQLRDA